MKTNIQAMRVTEVKSNDFGSAEIHLVSEIDFDKIDPLTLLQSGGTKKTVMFLRNLGSEEMIAAVEKKLQNQVINVCEFRFEVGELFDGASTITQTIVDDDGEKSVSTFTQLVENRPCAAGFDPTTNDIEGVKYSLIAQVERRIANGTYALK